MAKGIGIQFSIFSSVIGENLSLLLATDRIMVFPWPASMEIDYQIVVTVSRFDGKPGETVFLNARWTLLEGRNKKVLLIKNSSLSSSSGLGYEALVASQSRLIGDLSFEIAEAIQAISQETGNQEEEMALYRSKNGLRAEGFQQNIQKRFLN